MASIPQRRRSCRYEESLDCRKEKWSLASVSDKEFVLHVQGAELGVLPKRWFLLRQRQQVPVRGDYNNDLAIRDQSILKPSFKPTYTCSSQKLSFDWCSWRNSHQKPTADVTTAPQSWKKDVRVRKKLTDGQIPHSSYWRCLSKGSSLFHFLFEVAIKPCFVYSQSFNQLFVLHKKET